MKLYQFSALTLFDAILGKELTDLVGQLMQS